MSDAVEDCAVSEVEHRRLGMRSLDPEVISFHFARARRLREAAVRGTERARLFGAVGTKGASSPPNGPEASGA